MKVKVYADGADIKQMKKYYEEKLVDGFTTNPSLMKKAGVEDYKKFAKEVVEIIPDKSISFEVFSDDVETMEKEAKILKKFGKNVFVKIPIINTKGEFTTDLIKRLSAQGVNINVTAILTIDQVKKAVEAVDENSNTIISVFAGRLADTGVDPLELMKESEKICHSKKNVELLWASCRELLNVVQADEVGCDIITVPDSVIKKIPNIGISAEQVSLDTVKKFREDIKELGFSII